MFEKFLMQVRLTWRLLFDSRVPMKTKLIPLAAVVYVLSPLDIIPDLFLVIGQLDDIGLVLLSMQIFIQNAPADVVAEHQDALMGKRDHIIEGTATKAKRGKKEELR